MRTTSLTPSRVRSALAALVLSVAAGPACFPERITTVEDLASVVTLVDSQAPLRAARSFTLLDTIVHPTQFQGAGMIGHEADAEVLARIRAQFLRYGWRELPDSSAERPDVVVLTLALEQTRTGVAYGGWYGDWGYWGGWPAGVGSSWGWGYPYGTTFTYEVGTLMIAMLDLRRTDAAAQEIPLLWVASVNGVLMNSTLDGVLAGVDQAFEQSPYLERR